jgi:hypothetical protein
MSSAGRGLLTRSRGLDAGMVTAARLFAARNTQHIPALGPPLLLVRGGDGHAGEAAVTPQTAPIPQAAARSRHWAQSE